jgi:ribosomal protein L24E
MVVDGGAVRENDKGDGKSLVRDDTAVVDFRSTKLMKSYIRKQLRTQNYIYILENN